MSLSFDLAGITVMLAMPSHRDIPPDTVRSLMETQSACFVRGIPLDVEITTGSSLVHHARSRMAHRFLQSTRNRLFWVDSDMVWSADDFIRLLALSTKLECVCALYCSKEDNPRIFINVESDEIEANEYGCFRIKGAGLGFTVVQRKVVEELAAKAKPLKFPDGPEPIPHIFRCDDIDGYARGEDMAFFADISALGYGVNMDPSIDLGHVGAKEYRARASDFLIPKEP